MPQLNRIRGDALLVYTNPDGTPGWSLHVTNGVCYEGLNWLLNTSFLGLAPVQATRVGIISDAGFTGVSSSDTHSNHPGWVEVAAIAGVNRPTWTPSVAGSGLLGTTTPASFTFTGNGNFRGVFLSSVAPIGSVAPGVLYNTAYAVTALPYAIAGTLDVSFTVRLEI